MVFCKTRAHWELAGASCAYDLFLLLLTADAGPSTARVRSIFPTTSLVQEFIVPCHLTDIEWDIRRADAGSECDWCHAWARMEECSLLSAKRPWRARKQRPHPPAPRMSASTCTFSVNIMHFAVDRHLFQRHQDRSGGHGRPVGGNTEPHFVRLCLQRRGFTDHDRITTMITIFFVDVRCAA